MPASKSVRTILLYWVPLVLFATGIFVLSMWPDLRSQFPHTVDLVLRKIGHVAVYFVFTVLLARIGLRNNWTGFGWMVVLGLSGVVALTIAILDETIQLFISGRNGSIRDVLIDCIGILIAFATISYMNRRNSV